MEVASNDIYVQGNGVDDLGEFSVSGTIKGDKAVLQRIYKGPDKKAVSMNGTAANNVIKGVWHINNNGVEMQNEFAIYPADGTYSDSTDIYGFGGACKYAAEWTGSTSIDGGITGNGTLRDFTVSTSGVLSASGTDTWGDFTLNGQVSNKNVDMQKIYPNGHPVHLVGTLTTNVLQGTWTVLDLTGSFMFKPQ